MKTFKSALLLTALCATTFLSSCKKDKDPDPRDAFVGTYDMEADCGQFGQDEDELKITKNTSDDSQIIINSDLLEELGAEDIPATVTGSTFKMKSTTITIQDDEGNSYNVKLSGEGTLSGKTLTLQTEVNGQDLCEFEGDKK